MSAQTDIKIDTTTQPALSPRQFAARRQIALWLFGVAGLIFAMVIVGGLTRLTESGLSITEWEPIMGALPPMSDAAWANEFARYQQIPQYDLVNRGMDLSEFKTIFWWEWSHRFLGRFIGFAFLIPFLWFLATQRIKRSLTPQLAVMFLLGGAQGALGWWMVKSGLSDRIDVSQYRLVAHLGLATIIYTYMLWVALGLWDRDAAPQARSALRWSAVGLAVLVFGQMLLGGFVAGLKAGHIYNTWPLMDGGIVPQGLFGKDPWWSNFFENTATAQFDHRMVGYLVALLIGWHWLAARHSGSREAARGATWLALAVLGQVGLGIWALLWVVPVPLGAAHQAGALILLTLAIVHARKLNPPAR
jgi:cytochrome c oxidase assembly protein subunit 15